MLAEKTLFMELQIMEYCMQLIKKQVERFGVVPPLIIPKLPKVIAPSLNQTSGGGSTFIFIRWVTCYMIPILKIRLQVREGWHTLLMIPW